MEYDKQATEILEQLGINSPYKGCDYIASGMSYIHENAASYMPITKILYEDIARQYNTSTSCVERNIRMVIEIIWKYEHNRKMIDNIFDTYHSSRRPSNLQFLTSLYRHIDSGEHSKQVYDMYKDSIGFKCPLTERQCEFCNEILNIIIQALYK